MQNTPLEAPKATEASALIQPQSLSPGDLLSAPNFTKDEDLYRVTGVYIGGTATESVITLEGVGIVPTSFGEASLTLAMPLVFIEAGLTQGTFTHYKKGPFPLN